jgi:hypothetical protein
MCFFSPENIGHDLSGLNKSILYVENERKEKQK